MGKDLNGKQYNLSSLEYGVAGATTGVITRFLCQPLDVLKIRFQLQTTPLIVRDTAKYTSMVQALRVMAKEEGVTSFWKGHTPAQLLSVSFSAVQFSTYETVYEVLNPQGSYNHHWIEHFINICCGAVAGATATVVSFPFDVLRTHLIFQGEPKIYKGTLDAANQIFQNEGMRGFSKGMTAAVIQMAPMSGLTFSFKGIFREIWLWMFTQDARTPSMSTGGVAITSLLAGVCAKTVVYPLDLMKKRLQIQGFDEKRSYCKEMIKCTGIIDCFFITVRKEGFLGLFKGITPSVIKAGTSTAIYFTLYDEFCRLLKYTKR